MARAIRWAFGVSGLAAAVGTAGWFVHRGLTPASNDPPSQRPEATLQTVRGQIELHRVQTGAHAPSVTAGRGWADLVDAGYLQRPPTNALRGDASGIVVGRAGPNGPSTAGRGDGWYWSTDRQNLFAVAADGTIIDF